MASVAGSRKSMLDRPGLSSTLKLTEPPSPSLMVVTPEIVGPYMSGSGAANAGAPKAAPDATIAPVAKVARNAL